MIAATKTDIRMRIEEFGIVPSIRPGGRVSAVDDARFAVETLNAASVPILEVNMTVPGSLAVISQLTKTFPEMIIGADVLDLDMARRCADEGAKFLTSPVSVASLVEFALSRDVVVFPGALTPSEVVNAWKAGADLVKVFPCSQVGGAGYIKALHGPLPHIPLIASGGVNQQTAASFIRYGATALGIGGELVPRSAIQGRNGDQIRELARRFLGMIKDGRAQRMGLS